MLVEERPRLVKKKSRCLMLFHLLVPGGKWQTSMDSVVASASYCNSSFHTRRR